MSDWMKLLQGVHGKIKSILAEELFGERPVTRQDWPVFNRLKVLSMLVAGMVLSKNARLSEIAVQLPMDATNGSIAKRLQRFVENCRICVEEYYAPFAQEILQRAGTDMMRLVIDGSQIADGCMVLMVGLVRYNRALPICWRVYKQKKGHLGAKRHIEVFQMLLRLVGPRANLVILGDGEFDSPELIKWVRRYTRWHFVFRTGKDSQIKDGEEFVRMDALGVKPNRAILLPCVTFTATGQVQGLSALAWWDKEYDEPVFLISDLAEMTQIMGHYQHRPFVETLFSDQKTRGFGIDKSRLRTPERVERLLLAACLAYLWLIFLGAEVIRKGIENYFEASRSVRKSCFRLGLDYFWYHIKHGHNIPVYFSSPMIT